MRILFFSSYPLWAESLDTDLELISSHSSRQDEVDVIVCHSDLPTCDSNPSHLRYHCGDCRATGRRALSLVGIPKSRRHQLGWHSALDESAIPPFETIDALRAFTWKGIPVGEHVASVLIMGAKEPKPDMSRATSLVNKQIATFASVYTGVSKVIEKLRPDRFYVANGRGPVLGAALRAAKDFGVSFVIHERPTASTYYVAENYDIWSLKSLTGAIERESRAMEGDASASRDAEDWFERNRQGKVIPNWVAGMYRYRKHGVLPETFDEKKRNIAVFISSEHEFEALQEWKNPFFRNQAEGVSFLLSRLTDDNFHFYLRLHPFLAGTVNSQTRALAALSAPNMTLLAADTRVDSYALVLACEKTLTFGSTVGVEATFYGKPSILVGRSMYESLDAAYVPKNKEDIVTLVRSHLSPKPRTNALRFGYWQKMNEHPFSFVTPDGKNAHSISGRNVRTLLSERSFFLFVYYLHRAKNKMVKVVLGLLESLYA